MEWIKAGPLEPNGLTPTSPNDKLCDLGQVPGTLHILVSSMENVVDSIYLGLLIKVK